ncbi:hypothetical protein HFN89_04980 [Rhizobium laguerreae]|nr:hypothetical protein [Rhizobium laguerreae]
MQSLLLPYMTSSLTAVGRTGKLKFGWREAQSNIREADPSDFRIAYGRIINAESSFNIYEFDGLFWSSAFAPVRPMVFNSGGVRLEARYQESETNWIEFACTDAFRRRLCERARAEGISLGKDSSIYLKFRSRLAPSDGHESDRTAFLTWAAENLVWADGHLMKRVHSPSIIVGLGHSQFSMALNCRPFRGSSYICGFGRHAFEPGLHFRPGDPDFEASWAEAEDRFGIAVRQSEHAHNRHYVYTMEQAIGSAGFADRLTIHDNVFFDRSVLADVSDDGWEDMGERTAVSVVESIVATAAPHFHRPGPKRDALEELKRLVEIIPQDRGKDFQDRLDCALASLPTEGEPARAWFVNKALEQCNAREIALTPVHNVARDAARRL